MISPSAALSLPEWYCLERETEKIMSKLASVKELDFYLRHQDEYIRRLAIIRLSVLKPRGLENILGDVLDNSLESNENKELAAWAIKAGALKWKTEVIVNNRYLTRYTGDEKLTDLFRVSRDELKPSLSFNFHQAAPYMQELPEQDSMADIRDISFQAVFPLKEWLLGLTAGIFSGLKAIPLLLVRGIPAVFKFFAGKIRQRHKNSPRQMKSPMPENNFTGLYHKTYEDSGIMSLISHSRAPTARFPRFSPIKSLTSLFKRVIFNMLYVLFFPVRLVLRHKLVLLYIVAILYVPLNFTDFGKTTFTKYFGRDFVQEQSKAFETVRKYSYSIWDKFTDMTSLDGIIERARSNTAAEAVNTAKPGSAAKYSVTAAKGLNIRKAPDAASEKIQGGPLLFGSIVTYLEKTGKDKAGKVWYYILSSDGRSGWVSASYLKLVKKG